MYTDKTVLLKSIKLPDDVDIETLDDVADSTSEKIAINMMHNAYPI